MSDVGEALWVCGYVCVADKMENVGEWGERSDNLGFVAGMTTLRVKVPRDCCIASTPSVKIQQKNRAGRTASQLNHPAKYNSTRAGIDI